MFDILWWICSLSLLGIGLFQNLYLVFFPRSNFQPQMWKCFLMLGQTFWTSLRASGRWQHLVHVSPWITCNHLVASWGGDHPENCPAVTFKLSEHQSRTTSGGAGHFLDCEPCQQQQQKTSNVAKNVPSLFFLPFQANCPAASFSLRRCKLPSPMSPNQWMQ